MLGDKHPPKKKVSHRDQTEYDLIIDHKIKKMRKLKKKT